MSIMHTFELEEEVENPKVCNKSHRNHAIVLLILLYAFRLLDMIFASILTMRM